MTQNTEHGMQNTGHRTQDTEQSYTGTQKHRDTGTHKHRHTQTQEQRTHQNTSRKPIRTHTDAPSSTSPTHAHERDTHRRREWRRHDDTEALTFGMLVTLGWMKA